MPLIHTFEQRFTEVLDGLHIDPIEKTLIINRFVHLVTATRRNSSWITILFLAFTNMITIGGVIIVAFLTLEKVALFGEQVSLALFWTSLTLSISVTIANKLLYSFNIAKKYLFNGVLLAKYESEGWLFLAGTGRYNLDMPGRTRLFLDRIEKIYIKSIEIMTTMDGATANKEPQPTRPEDGTRPPVTNGTSNSEIYTLHTAENINDSILATGTRHSVTVPVKPPDDNIQ
jgi:hypothetical protein